MLICGVGNSNCCYGKLLSNRGTEIPIPDSVTCVPFLVNIIAIVYFYCFSLSDHAKNGTVIEHSFGKYFV